MSLLSILSPALTTATQAAGAYENAEGQADQTRRNSIITTLMQQRAERQAAVQRALYDSEQKKYDAQADYYEHRADALDHPTPKAPHVLASALGFMTLGPDGHAAPVTTADGSPVMPMRGTGRAASSARPLAETPQHREARQNFNATETQLHGVQGELRTLLAQRRPLMFTSPQDSVDYESKQSRIHELEGLRDTLGARADSLSGAMRGDFSIPGTPGGHRASATPQTANPNEQREYEQAARAFQAAGGAANPTARTTYNKIVQAIAAKYSSHAGNPNGPTQTPTSPAAVTP